MSTANNKTTVVSVPVIPYLYHWLRSKYDVNSEGEIVVKGKREPGGILLEIYKNSIRKRTYHDIFIRHGKSKLRGYLNLYIRYQPKNESEVCMFDELGIYYFNRTFDIQFKEMMMMFIYANIENGSNSIKDSLLKFLLINKINEDYINFDSLMRYIMRRMDKEYDRLSERAKFLIGIDRRPSVKNFRKKNYKNKGVLLLNLKFDSCQDTPALM